MYSCDICHDVIDHLNRTSFVAFEFAGTSAGGHNLFRAMGPLETERHICMKCLNGFNVLYMDEAGG